VRGVDANEGVTPLIARTDTNVSTTPSSNRFGFTLDAICVSHLIEPDMPNRDEGDTHD
jgi:hypothetical protein